MTAFPKPEPRKKPRNRNQAIAAYHDWVATRGCIVPGCGRRASLHHVRGCRNTTTGHALQRRNGAADAVVIPLCIDHHQYRWDAIHNMTEEAFGVEHLGGSTAVQEWAMSLLARYVSEGRA